MEAYFDGLVTRLTEGLRASEVLLANYGGEASDFVRFNGARIRQPGSVHDQSLSLALMRGRRQASGTVTLAGREEADLPRLGALLSALRERLPQLPEDPYLLYNTEVRSSSQQGADHLPAADAAVASILTAAGDRDLVGIYTQGAIRRGFANSLGQRNWFVSHSFHFDWTFYLEGDKAAKGTYGGFEWDPAAFDEKVRLAAAQADLLRRPAVTIQPGDYRVYLAPAALNEFVGMLRWGGFGLKSRETKYSPLLRLSEGEAHLSQAVTLYENTRDGLAPNFQGSGFLKPDCVKLIDRGRPAEVLVSPRSAREYGVPTNGAGGAESPESLDMAAGDLAEEEILARLGTGVYVNTLWYLNFSDRPGGRITGMTRFATFWVEDGEIVAPLKVMRFDETVYRALGDRLLALSRTRDFLPSNTTYGGRSTASSRLPGALVDAFRFTL